MSVPDEARLMGEQHLRVVPIGPGTKHPPIPKWQERATSDTDTHASWWDPHPEWGVGWKMGRQDDGRFLVAIDVDVDKGGRTTLQQLFEERPGLREEFQATVRAVTGRDGAHFVFELPPDAPHPTNRAHFRNGIDIRAEGGQIVVQPSLHPETGKMYRWVAEHQPWVIAPRMAGSATLQLLADFTISPPLRVVPSENALWRPGQGEGETPADWVRRTQDFTTYLLKHGWEHAGGTSWRRPGKTDRGSSAELKGDGLGPLNIFTTDIPAAIEALGTLDRTGQCISVSLFDFISAYEFDGDRSACASHFRRVMNQLAGAVAERAAAATAPADEDATALCPSPEFYDQRPWMAACRQMAEAVGGSPAAHLLAFLARWATLIPPGYSIPPINGAPSSFDLLCVIAGTSGSGKTSPMRNAARMLPVQRKDLRMGLGIGSGEGVIEAFYSIDEVRGDDGKTHKERGKNIAGVNFAVSEGLIFVELAGRGGTTHVTRLCDAWSGAALSTANASAETFRHIPEDQYRLTMVMGIQAKQSHELMTDTAASQGFVGRLLFAWTEEPRAAPRPRPPEPFVLPVPPEVATPKTKEAPKTYQPTYLEYPDEVYAEIQGASDARVGTDVPVEDHHHDLLRCKVAGIVALMDGRTSVSLEDWAIATALVAHSRSVRLHLYGMRRRSRSVERHNAAVARGEADAVAETAKERRSITEYKAKVLARLRLEPAPFGTDKGLGKMAKSDRRWMVRSAVDELVAEGAIVKGGDRYELAP